MATMEPIEAINLSEFILSKMMESVGGGEASPSRFNHTMPNEEDSVDPTDPGAGNDEASTWSSLGLDDLPNPRNNVRVRSMVVQREMDAQADDSYRPTPGRISEEEEKGGEDMENVSDHMVTFATRPQPTLSPSLLRLTRRSRPYASPLIPRSLGSGPRVHQTQLLAPAFRNAAQEGVRRAAEKDAGATRGGG